MCDREVAEAVCDLVGCVRLEHLLPPGEETVRAAAERGILTRGWGGEPDPRRTFHQQADFGHLAEKLRTMKPYCRAQASTEAGISRCQRKFSAF